MGERQLFQFESGRIAKPDRLEAGLVHKIGAAFLAHGFLVGRVPRFNVRAYGSWDNNLDKPRWLVSGEVSDFLLNCDTSRTVSNIALAHYNLVHPSRKVDGVALQLNLKPQASSLATNMGAGDEGNPIAVAYAAGPHYLPWERFLAVGIRQLIDTIYHSGGQVPSPIAEASGVSFFSGLHADGKISVGCVYDGTMFHSLDSVTISVEHQEDTSLERLREQLGRVVNGYLTIVEGTYKHSFARGSSLAAHSTIINPLGAWHRGGLLVDDGLSEAKPHEDFFGSRGCNEDAPWGEDSTKPSGTGTIAARHAATQLVAQGLAHYAKVTLHYTIGSDDVRVNVFTEDTGTLCQSRLERWVLDNCPLSIPSVTERFDLLNSRVHEGVACELDFFHSPAFAWNK